MYPEGPGEDQMRSIGIRTITVGTLPEVLLFNSHKFLVLLFSGFTEAHGVPAVLPISLREILYAATSKNSPPSYKVEGGKIGVLSYRVLGPLV